jgi:hypothetical protein
MHDNHRIIANLSNTAEREHPQLVRRMLLLELMKYRVPRESNISLIPLFRFCCPTFCVTGRENYEADANVKFNDDSVKAKNGVVFPVRVYAVVGRSRYAAEKISKLCIPSSVAQLPAPSNQREV